MRECHDLSPADGIHGVLMPVRHQPRHPGQRWEAVGGDYSDSAAACTRVASRSALRADRPASSWRKKT